MTDHDPEFDAIVEELEAAGLVTVGTDADGAVVGGVRLVRGSDGTLYGIGKRRR